MTTKDMRIRILTAIGDVPAAAWDACANPMMPSPSSRLVRPNSQCPVGPQLGPAVIEPPFRLAGFPYNPFISHAFLNSLEASKSATARTGWQPQHLLVETKDGQAIGAVPCYLKSHSRGEYVFDAGWAEAYENAGGQYYP